jgi:hypothetical protein
MPEPAPVAARVLPPAIAVAPPEPSPATRDIVRVALSAEACGWPVRGAFEAAVLLADIPVDESVAAFEAAGKWIV